MSLNVTESITFLVLRQKYECSRFRPSNVSDHNLLNADVSMSAVLCNRDSVEQIRNHVLSDLAWHVRTFKKRFYKSIEYCQKY